MNIKQFCKIMMVLLVCTIYLFAFSHFGVLAYNQLLKPNNTFDEDTMIGPVNMEGKTKQEALDLLKNKITNWTNSIKITEHYMEKEEAISADFILFNADESVKNAISGNKNPIVITISKEKLKEEILGQFPEINEEHVDFTLLKDYLTKQVDSLGSTQINIAMENFINGEKPRSFAEVYRSNKKATKGVKAFVQAIPSIEVKGNSQFSFMDLLKEKGYQGSSDKDLSIIASYLYELILQTNFSVIERNQSASLPDYVDLGFEARINQDLNQDFIFANPNKTAYTFQFKIMDNGLYVSLKGTPFAFKYQYVLKDKQSFSPRTIKQFSALVPVGSSQVKNEGKDGMLIKMTREIRNQNGELMKTEEMGEDFYPPIPKILIFSLQESKETPDVGSDESSTISVEPDADATAVEEGSQTNESELEGSTSKDTSEEISKEEDSNETKNSSQK